MKIIDNTDKAITFANLNVGAVFKYKTRIAMKMEDVIEDGEAINAVDLSNGEALVFYGYEDVTSVDAILTINRKES